jgi:hypothetical protein
MSASVAYCCLIHNEEDIVYWQLYYYYRVGIRDFFIGLNTADDLTPLMIHAFQIHHPDANVDIVRYLDRDYEGFPRRKMDIYQRAGQAGFDWILPLDADELITLQDADLRKGFDIPTYLNETFPDAKPNDYIKFPAYDFICTPSDDYAEVNPFERMIYRETHMSMGKVIWRYGENSAVFRGAHNIINGNEGLRSDVRPMTAHYQIRSPIQYIKKVVAFGQSATHDCGEKSDITNPKVPEGVTYNPKTDFTGVDTGKSLAHQDSKAKGLAILNNLKWSTDKLKAKQNQSLILDTVWEDTL